MKRLTLGQSFFLFKMFLNHCLCLKILNFFKTREEKSTKFAFEKMFYNIYLIYYYLK